MLRLKKVAYLFISILAMGSALSSHSAAQQLWDAPPEFQIRDGFGVDLLGGSASFDGSVLQIGNDKNSLGLSYTLHTERVNGTHIVLKDNHLAGFGPKVGYSVNTISTTKYFNYNGINATFHKLPNGTWQALLNLELSMTESGAIFTVTMKDGTELTIDASQEGVFPEQNKYGILTKIKEPDGRVLDYYYITISGKKKLLSVLASDGLHLKYTYSTSGSITTTVVTAINHAYEYCNPTATTCSLSQTWPSVTYNYYMTGIDVAASTAQQTLMRYYGSYVSVTKPTGAVTKYTLDERLRVSKIKAGTSASATTTDYNYFEGQQYGTYTNGGSHNKVFEVKVDGSTWTYTYMAWNNPPPSAWETQLTNNVSWPNGKINTVSAYSGNGTTPNWPTGATIDGIEFDFFNSPQMRVESTILPNGETINQLYDARANIFKTTYSAPGETDRVVETEFVATRFDPTVPYQQLTSDDILPCLAPKVCNNPIWVEDAKGNRTDYTYHAASGMIEKVKQPADSNGFRPETRYSYVQKYPWYKNSSGTQVQSSTPIWVLSEESYCRNGAASGSGCATSSDEVKTTYDYGSSSGSNNLWIRGVVYTSNGVSRRTCFSYDQYGNKISETAPRANLSTCN